MAYQRPPMFNTGHTRIMGWQPGVDWVVDRDYSVIYFTVYREGDLMTHSAMYDPPGSEGFHAQAVSNAITKPGQAQAQDQLYVWDDLSRFNSSVHARFLDRNDPFRLIRQGATLRFPNFAVEAFYYTGGASGENPPPPPLEPCPPRPPWPYEERLEGIQASAGITRFGRRP